MIFPLNSPKDLELKIIKSIFSCINLQDFPISIAVSFIKFFILNFKLKKNY